MDKIATQETSRFLGLFRGVFFDYQILNPYVLETDLERIERYYKARGFYEAKVVSARVIREDENFVRISIGVTEGPPVTVQRVRVRGLERLPEPLQTAAQAAALGQLDVGDWLEEDKYRAAESAVERSLTDSGYARASVRRAARVDLASQVARVAYFAQPGEPALFGEVTYAGLKGIPEAPVQRAVNIKPGEVYSTESLTLARQAALELGVFSSIDVEPQLTGPDATSNVIPVKVEGRVSPLRTLRLGVGVRLDSVRTDAHLLAGWQNRNFLGGLRRLSLEVNPSVVFFGTRLPELSPPEQLLPQLEMRADFRQPGLFEARTNGLLRAEYGIRAVLTRNTTNQETILGYRETRAGAGLDRSFGRYLYLRPSQNLQINTPFAYAGPLDDDLNPRLLIAYVELLGSLDLRNDRVKPRRGLYLSVQPQVAGPLGDASDVRLHQEARGYVPLARRVTLALRTTVGFLFPFNYGEPDFDGERLSRVRDLQMTYFRGFFSGGTSSNRGYPARGVGPHAVVDFFFSGTSVGEQDCSLESTEERCKLPVGGLSLWEASGELRFDVSGPLSLNAFCDASDVSPVAVDIRLDRPHLSCGPGLRYDTPVGPIRFDIGVRIPELQILAPNVGVEGSPPTLFGLPVAIAVGIGEAF
jgi:outer membrane protein insertion porin family/translocation and assembly module TamA